MKYVRLGRTGWQVSRLSLGTVALGMEYGLRAPAQFEPPVPRDAIRLIHAALDRGVNLFDTAPRYGSSEALLGRALEGRGDCHVATKVDLAAGDVERAVRQSITQSLGRLRRDVLDLVQIHNATAAVIADGRLIAALQDLQCEGRVRALGASVYDEEAALAAIASGAIDVLQIPYSVLDRRFALRALPAAAASDVAVIARSILLKGVLTPKARYLPATLAGLGQAAERCRRVFDCRWEELPGRAIRYCAGVEGLHTLLLGVRTEGELAQALDAVDAPPFAPALAARLEDIGVDDPDLLNPATWGEAVA
jgi:aryl-alcohol dehydrogenase-like predicted oxidoreductase